MLKFCKMGDLNKNMGCSFPTEINYSSEVDEDSVSYYSDEYVDSEREIEISDLEYKDEDEVEGQTHEQQDKNIYSTSLQFIPFSLIETRRRLAQVNAEWNNPRNFDDTEERTYKVAFRPESELVSVINFSAYTSTPEDTEGNDSVGEDVPKEKWQDDGILFRPSDSVNISDHPQTSRVDLIVSDVFEEDKFSRATITAETVQVQPVDLTKNQIVMLRIPAKIGLRAKDSIENLLSKSPPSLDNTINRQVETSTKFQSEKSEVELLCPTETTKKKRLPKPKRISSPRYSEDSRTRFLQLVANHNVKNSDDQCHANKSDIITMSPCNHTPKQTHVKRADTPRLSRKNSEIVPGNTPVIATRKNVNDRKRKDILNIFTRKSLHELSSLGQGSDLLPGIRAQVVAQNISVEMMSSVFNDEFVSLVYNVEPVKSKWATKPVHPENVRKPENSIRARLPKLVQENAVFERMSQNQNSVVGKQLFESERRIKETVGFPRVLSGPVDFGKTETNGRKKGSLIQRIAETNHKVLVLPSSARKEKSVSPMKRPMTQ